MASFTITIKKIQIFKIQRDKRTVVQVSNVTHEVLVKVLVMIFVAVNVALNKPSYKQNHFNKNYNILGDYMCI